MRLLLSTCSIFVLLDFVINVVCLVLVVVLVVDVNIVVETVFCSCFQVVKGGNERKETKRSDTCCSCLRGMCELLSLMFLSKL